MAVVKTKQPVLVDEPPGPEKEQPHGAAASTSASVRVRRLVAEAREAQQRRAPRARAARSAAHPTSRDDRAAAACRRASGRARRRSGPDSRAAGRCLPWQARCPCSDDTPAPAVAGPAFPAKAGDWPVNGGFLVGFSLAMRMKHLACRPRAHPVHAARERRGPPAGRPGGTPRKADGAAWPRHARHLLECSDARLLGRRRLRVPAGEQPPVSDGHRSAGDDSGPDAGKHQPAGNPVHPRGRRAPRALGGPQPHPGGSHGAKRHPDRDDRRSVRFLRGRDVLEASHGRRDGRVRTVLWLRSPTDAPGCRCCSNRRSA